MTLTPTTGAVLSAQLCVLVVDDYPDGREVCAEYLAFSGFRVLQAADGQEALDLAFAEHPDLILMDLSLPGMDGWEATRRLKADRRTARTPVIALTAHALDSHAASARAAGADAVVTKPFLPNELVAEVRRQLAAHSAGRGATKKSKRSAK